MPIHCTGMGSFSPHSIANTTLGDGSATASLSVAAGTGYAPGGTTQHAASVANGMIADNEVQLTPTVIPTMNTLGLMLLGLLLAAAAAFGMRRKA